MRISRAARAGLFFRSMLGVLLVHLAVAGHAVPAAEPNGFRDDALSIEKLINDNYAYLDRFEGGKAPVSTKLRAEAEQVADKRSLLRYAERALLLLADHHAITGSSRADSWALVPSYSDLWIEKRGNDYVIDAVRAGSPAARAGIAAGDRLVSVDGVPTAGGVNAFWADLGVFVTEERAAFAARILAAGRRDRPRRLTLRKGRAEPRLLEIASLYAAPRVDQPALSVASAGGDLRIRFNDSLGNSATIAAFDAAMSKSGPRTTRRHRPHGDAGRGEYECRPGNPGLVRHAPGRVSGPQPAPRETANRNRTAVDRTGPPARGQAPCRPRGRARRSLDREHGRGACHRLRRHRGDRERRSDGGPARIGRGLQARTFGACFQASDRKAHGG